MVLRKVTARASPAGARRSHLVLSWHQPLRKVV